MTKSEKKWYVAHTYSGHEQKAKRYLENEVVNRGLQDKVGRVLVPTETILEMKHGKRTTTVKKFLPSYILIEMELSKETRHLVTSTPGVTSFVGTGGKPVPLRENEVKRVLSQAERGKTRDFEEVPFKAGDPVKVIDGPFTDFSGFVSEVNMERKQIKVMVSIFGRPTPVELDFLQVQPV
ncbi:MAG: transcription termination/antitermination protein NusG [Candidatus Zixiibacteriota bacterium]